MSRTWVRMACWALLLSALCSGSASAQVVLKPNGQMAIPLKVKSLDADAVIDGQFAHTRLLLTFQNETSERIEADFMYTLPPDTLVTSFAYWYGDEKVQARIVEKQEAAAIYAHITTRMRDPALVEMVGKNTFRARIFPVMPNSDLKVEMTLVQTLPSDAKGAHFTLPLRMAKGEPLDRVNARVTIRTDATVMTVNNNYRQAVTHGSDGFRLTLFGTNFRPQQDLRVNITRHPRPLQAALYSTPIDATNGYFALALTADRAINHPRVHLDGVNVSELLPIRLPNMKPHQSIVLVGRYRGNGAAIVRVTGGDGRTNLALTGRVVFGPRPKSASLAGKMWAARWIEHLSDGLGNRSRIMRLSFESGLPSKFTSWLAVPRAEMERYEREIAEAKMEVVASHLAALIAAGREDSRAARRLRRQLNAICKRIDRNPNDALQDQVGSTVDAVARSLATQIAEGRENSRQARRLRHRLNVMCKMAGFVPQNLLVEHLNQNLREAAGRLAEMIGNGQGDEQAARRLRTRLGTLSRQTNTQPRQWLDTAIPDTIGRWAADLVTERHSEHPDARRMTRLSRAIARLAHVGKRSFEPYMAIAESNWRDMEEPRTVDRLVHEYGRPNPDPNAIRRLTDQYVALQTNDRDREYARARAQRLGVRAAQKKLDHKIEIATAAGDRQKVTDFERQQAELQSKENELRVRMGDPLIRVQAPADAVQVIAVMPGGEIKKLIYNHRRGLWEARFDVPAYAVEADYVITVVIVLKNGERRTLVMHYHVDLTAPAGAAKAAIGAPEHPTLRLELDAGDDAARVKALLPWGELVELRRSAQPHRFFALVPVTAERRSAASVVSFIITDRAHNRTTIAVDMSAR